MTFSENSQTARGRYARVLAAMACGFLVQGCAGGLPQFSGPKPSEQVIIPEPEPTVALTSTGGKATPKATDKSGSQTRGANVTEVKSTALVLDVTYFVRLMVPVGSELTIRSEGSGRPSTKTIKTAGGPPYAITLPVDGTTGAFPMKITATLNSTIGHVLEGEVVLPKKPGGSVDIVMVPKTDS